jgi:hypothetical protein
MDDTDPAQAANEHVSQGFGLEGHPACHSEAERSPGEESLE